MFVHESKFQSKRVSKTKQPQQYVETLVRPHPLIQGPDNPTCEVFVFIESRGKNGRKRNDSGLVYAADERRCEEAPDQPLQ